MPTPNEVENLRGIWYLVQGVSGTSGIWYLAFVVLLLLGVTDI